MADRTYDLLIDTAENRKIAETLRRYNNIKNTNGQPNYLWKVPHISGQPSLKGGSCCSECKMTGGAMPNSVLLQMDERQTLQRPRGMVSPYTQPPDKYIISGNRPLYPQFNSVELDALNNRKVGGGWGAVEGYNPDGTKMTKEQYEAYLKKPRARAMYVRHDDGKPVFGRPDIKPKIDVMPRPAVMPNPEIVLDGAGIFGALAKTGAKTGAKYAVKGAKLAVAGAKQGAKIAVMVASNPAVQEVVKEIANDKDVQKAVNFHHYLEEKNYFKAVKRLYSYAKIKNMKPLIKALLKVINSQLGRQSKLIADLNTINDLITNNFRKVPKSIILHNLSKLGLTIPKNNSLKAISEYITDLTTKNMELLNTNVVDVIKNNNLLNKYFNF